MFSSHATCRQCEITPCKVQEAREILYNTGTFSFSEAVISSNKSEEFFEQNFLDGII